VIGETQQDGWLLQAGPSFFAINASIASCATAATSPAPSQNNAPATSPRGGKGPLMITRPLAEVRALASRAPARDIVPSNGLRAFYVLLGAEQCL
jgi:hypothetical protein